MHSLRGGTILGLAVGGYTLLVVVTGLYTNTFATFWMTMLIEFAGAVWLLRRGAARGNRYFAQLTQGTLAFIVAAFVIAMTGYFTLSFVAPDYGDVIIDAYRRRALASGHPPDDLERQLEAMRPLFYPLRQSLLVIPATIVTGIGYSAVIAIFVRKKAGPVDGREG